MMYPNIMYGLRHTVLLLLFAALASGCPSLAGYDQRAYENATSLKAATLSIMAKSDQADSYSPNEAAIDALLVSLHAAYEYANGIEHNNEAAKNWRDLIGDDEQMIGAWLRDWQDGGSVSTVLLEELKPQIAEGFNTIICLEANKRQVTACASLKNSK